MRPGAVPFGRPPARFLLAQVVKGSEGCGQRPASIPAPHTSGQRIMGKTTGFMEYERLEEGYAPVAERVKHYKEFVIGLDDSQAKIQGDRKSTRLNSSHQIISYAVFCLKKKKHCQTPR